MKWYCWQSLGSGPGPTLDGRYWLIDPKARHRSRPDAQPVRRSAFPEGSAATTQRSASSRADVDRPSVTPPTPSIIDASPPEKLLTFDRQVPAAVAATWRQRCTPLWLKGYSNGRPQTGTSLARRTTRRIYRPIKKVGHRSLMYIRQQFQLDKRSTIVNQRVMHSLFDRSSFVRQSRQCTVTASFSISICN